MEQTTEEILFGASIPREDLPALIKAYRVPTGATALMLLERLPQNIIKPEERQDLLLFEPFHLDVDFALYTTGRIFHTRGELRWERQQAATRIVYTGERTYKPELHESEEMTLKSKPEVRKYFLFGKRLAEAQRNRIGPAARIGDFAEVRIPRLLRYPLLDTLKDAEYLRLAVCEYMDHSTGKTIAYRCKELVPFPEQSKEQA